MSDEVLETVQPVGMPRLNEPAPAFEAVTTHGIIRLADYEGSWLILFSHPADFTPVCTTEFVAFQKRIKEFEDMGVKLVGMSVDQVFSHIKWVEWIKEKLDVDITFPIIAANDTIANKLGMLHPGKGSNTVRAVFVVDPESKVRLVLYYPQEIGRNMDEIVRATKALMASDANGIATPAGWPDNELIGDKVIVPPAQSQEEAKKRPDQYECYDWWFCYRDLK
jgi:peroxiredoxin (alkyl hydroperoxide reductase subunit C)